MKTMQIFHSNVLLHDYFMIAKKDDCGVHFPYTRIAYFKNDKAIFINEEEKLEIHASFEKDALIIETEKWIES